MSEARSEARRCYVLSEFFLEAGTVELFPLALGAVPLGIEEARELLLLVLLLLPRQAQTVFGVVQCLLLLRRVWHETSVSDIA